MPSIRDVQIPQTAPTYFVGHTHAFREIEREFRDLHKKTTGELADIQTHVVETVIEVWFDNPFTELAFKMYLAAKRIQLFESFTQHDRPFTERYN